MYSSDVLWNQPTIIVAKVTMIALEGYLNLYLMEIPDFVWNPLMSFGISQPMSVSLIQSAAAFENTDLKRHSGEKSNN